MNSFAEELTSLGKRRIGLTDLRAAYLRAYPEALTAPDLRRLLLDALRGLESVGAIDLPQQGWDRSGSPSLPRTARLCSPPDVGRPRPPQAWLPALAFAADERHPTRRADLQAINAFLLSLPGNCLSPVPTRERSLQIFGDEKRLDHLRKGKPFLFKGRISLEDLRCYPVAPPLPCESPAIPVSGRPIFVLENYHSYDSFRRWNREAAQYAAIAYGGGNAFRQGDCNLDNLIAVNAADGAVYLGDLDPSGTTILIGVNQLRRSEGRSPIRPHHGLYNWLLEHGCRRPLETPPTDRQTASLPEVFPAGIATALVDLWSAGQRIPQESFGLDQLSGEDATVAGPGNA